MGDATVRTKSVPRPFRPPTERGPNGRYLCKCGCGEEVPEGSRAWWRPGHVEAWKLRHCMTTQRRAVQKRDRGRCAACGAQGGPWEMDHILPVVEGGGVGREGDPLENLQTLCVPCHKLKTAREATERAQRRRAEGGDARG